jgi:hypothetical protein
MQDQRNGADPASPGQVISAEGIGMLVAFLDSHRVEQRRYRALRRLSELQIAARGWQRPARSLGVALSGRPGVNVTR